MNHGNRRGMCKERDQSGLSMLQYKSRSQSRDSTNGAPKRNAAMVTHAKAANRAMNSQIRLVPLHSARPLVLVSISEDCSRTPPGTCASHAADTNGSDEHDRINKSHLSLGYRRRVHSRKSRALL